MHRIQGDVVRTTLTPVIQDESLAFDLGDSATVAELLPFQTIAHYARYFAFQRWKQQFWSGTEIDSQTLIRHLQLKEDYRSKWGDFLPTEELVDTLVTMLWSEFGHRPRVLDAGSGSGFFSQELCRRGLTSFAVDIDAVELRGNGGLPKCSLHQRDVLGDAVSFVGENYEVIVVTQPPYLSPMLHRIATAMRPGQLLIVEGEPWSCEEEREFWRVTGRPNWIARDDMQKRLNDAHVTFVGHNDHWHAFQKTNTTKFGMSCSIRQVVCTESYEKAPRS